MKGGKETVCRGIYLLSEESVSDSDANRYNYLGILELDDILHTEMKEKIKETHLKSNMNARNLVTAMNMWAVAMVRKKMSINKWAKEEITGEDQKKTMTMQIVYKEKKWM